MKGIAMTIIVVLMTTSYLSTAQSLQTKILNTSGSTATAGNIILEWSLGEMTAVTTLAANNKILTQGLLQPFAQLQSPLPVTWLYTKAKLVNGRTELEWKVAQEFNNDHFDIERSADGSQFSFLKKKMSYGNSSTPQTYADIDPSPFSGITYYRIKQVDIDGKYEYSNIVFVRTQNGITYKLFPNPVTDILTIDGYLPSEETSYMVITDAAGREVKSIKGIPNQNQQRINVGGLPNGSYFLKVENSKQNIVLPFVKR